MANEFPCKICGYQEGTHLLLETPPHIIIKEGKKGDEEYQKKLVEDYPNLCMNYEKTDEEIYFDKNHPDI